MGFLIKPIHMSDETKEELRRHAIEQAIKAIKEKELKMTGLPIHKDLEIQEAIVHLLDLLCQWERNTGRESAVIIREKDYNLRAASGKCDVPDDIPDEIWLGRIVYSI